MPRLWGEKGKAPEALPTAHSPHPPSTGATHQRHNPADRHHAWPDAAARLQGRLHVLGDEEGLIVPDFKFCAEEGASTEGEPLRLQAKAVCSSEVHLPLPAPQSPSPVCLLPPNPINKHLKAPALPLPLPERSFFFSKIHGLFLFIFKYICY